ncbi:hypothetical protein PISMIDRAFT_672205 [Pisolithus microcarpus 441]|uniref:Uncharacterized protein n=1 Tax=Pisolithus microcarpus 441 TaxID=765257 RepID=A0A0D0AC03_9AGAM|nr:hypothetical protein PISMIDRAFT_672205 [Pisolithus microcarpus 441]
MGKQLLTWCRRVPRGGQYQGVGVALLESSVDAPASRRLVECESLEEACVAAGGCLRLDQAIQTGVGPFGRLNTGRKKGLCLD